MPRKQRITPTLVIITMSARFSADKVWEKPSAIIPMNTKRAAMLRSVF